MCSKNRDSDILRGFQCLSNAFVCILTLLSVPLSSFGFTEKGAMKFSHMAIGVYGNGFKSGSMRLGRDVLIFTKNGGCQSVGLLSQTYLENIKAQAVIIPIVPFNQQTNILYEKLSRENKNINIACFLSCLPRNLLNIMTLTQCYSVW